MEELFASTFEDPPYVDDFAFGRRDGHAALAATSDGVAFLLEQLKKPSLLRRWNAVLALSYARDEGERVSSALCAELLHPHPLYRRQVRWALHRLAPHFNAALVSALTDPAQKERAQDALAFHDPAGELVDPKEPIPYLGEHVCFFSERTDPRDEYEIDLWFDATSEFVRQEEFDAESLFSLDAWTPEVEARACKSLDWWKPGQLVLARRSITLTFFDWATGSEAEAKIESEDPRGFTMGELMHQVQRVYDAGAHAFDRNFEGLRLKAPGRYSIETGS